MKNGNGTAASIGPIASPLKAALSVLASFETLFALFLFAGVYKADARFESLPFDLTAAFFAASVGAGAVALAKRRFALPAANRVYAFLALVFVTYVLTTLLWTPSVVYARQKSLHIATLVFWSFLGTALIVSQETARVRRFFAAVSLLAVWVAVECLLFYLKAGPDVFVTALGGQGSYLILGRAVGLGFILFVCRAVFSEDGIALKAAWLCVIVFLFFILLVLGGRGPLLASVLPVLLLAVLRSRQLFRARYVLPVLLIAGALGCVFLHLAAGEGYKTISRFRLWSDPGSLDMSTDLRGDFYATAYRSWLKEPFLGHGVGAWAVLTEAGDERSYPHNLFLEILFELGLAGFLVFAVLLLHGVRTFRARAPALPVAVSSAVIMIAVNAMVNAMVTGDIPDNRVLFAMLGLLMVKPDLRAKTKIRFARGGPPYKGDIK